MMAEAPNRKDILEKLLGQKATPTVSKAARSGWRPVGDLRQTPSAYTVFVDLPGVDEDEITISYEESILRIEGERDFDHDREDAEEFTRIDRPYGSFRYEVKLESPVDQEHITAKYKRGVLKVRIPRGNALNGRLIEVD